MSEDWYIFQKNAKPHNKIKELPDPPQWRNFQEKQGSRKYRGEKFRPGDKEVEMVNTALYLRRPLLVTGKPGTGKSSLAYAVAHQLKLDEVLYWPISTRATLQDALYTYDAIGRLQETRISEKEVEKPEKDGDPQYDGKDENTCETPDIGRYITLGPLGTALMPSEKPRVLLIDEIDKSDIDLPNDLLNVFEEGGFDIPELKRLSAQQETVEVFPCDSDERVAITKGRVLCNAFPFVVITSNGERELPPPFLRRCLRLDIKPPDEKRLKEIVDSHFGETEDEKVKDFRKKLIDEFLKQSRKGNLLSTDQLLNAIYLAGNGIDVTDRESLRKEVLRHLNETESF